MARALQPWPDFLARRLVSLRQGTRGLLNWMDRRPFGLTAAASLLLGLLLGWSIWLGGTMGWLAFAVTILALAVRLAWSGQPVGYWTEEETDSRPTGSRSRFPLPSRRALQYVMARFSVSTLVSVPLIAFAVYLYRNRSQPLQQWFGVKGALLVTTVGIGILAFRYRSTLLDYIDFSFFREQYNARSILTLLVERIGSVDGLAALTDLVCRKVDLALQLERIALLVIDGHSGTLVDLYGRVRRLDAGSVLALLISNTIDPLFIDLEDKHSPLARLTEKEQHWLVDTGFRLLVPILARDGSLLGIIGLGEKKSGLPFLREDLQLLQAIANSAAWTIEIEASRGALSPEKLEAPWTAMECPNCGRLHPHSEMLCDNCSYQLELSRVPLVIPSKFRFEQRIGVGGMSVVYQGTDLAFDRPVAIKALKRISPESAMQLRRASRVAAAVSHPHLAPVYGMETWRETPMLVMELLVGGSLARRIEHGRLSAAETIDLGIAMADALVHLHSADILHCDIKPSNIGFTREGVPKLMDFGIARLLSGLQSEEAWEPVRDSVDESDSVSLTPTDIWSKFSVTSPSNFGTLSYFSPEALSGEPADAAFDLWALAIVLYECLIGRRIFSGKDMRQLGSRIRAGLVPDFSQVCPEHDEVLGDFFRSALHRDISQRPATALVFKSHLKAVRPLVGA